MKKEYGELVEYLDKKFDGIDQRFDKVAEKDDVNKRFDKIENSVISLDKRLAGVEDKVQNMPTMDDFRQLQNSVDAYAAKADKFFMEMVALAHKVDRLERWIQEIAEKVGIKLK